MPDAALPRGRVDTFTMLSTGDTLIGTPELQELLEKKSTHGQDVHKSTWQGKPNGTAYDRREELTVEDEDMWARMAM